MVLRDRSKPNLASDPADAARRAVAEMARHGAVPGMSVAVVRHDRLLFAEAFGWADLARQLPAAPATSYLWFSMTKIATATAAMRLADEGRLDLDAPVAETVDWLRRPDGVQPTMRHLLSHTSGLGNPVPIRWVHPAGHPGPDQETMLRGLFGRRRAFRHPTGRVAHYSNVGYLAAAQVISAVAGMPFEQYVQDAVLRPAGMTGTGFMYRSGAPAATGYVRAPRLVDPVLRLTLPSGVVGPRHGGYLSLRPFLVDGAGYGGLVGDVLDAARLLQLHLGDGGLDGHRVLTADAARAMRPIVATGKAFDHAIGWFRQLGGDDASYLEHFGAGAGFWNVMRIYPAKDLGIIAMSNSTSSYQFQPVFAQLASLDWP